MNIKQPLLANYELVERARCETHRQATGADSGHAVLIVEIVRLNFSLIVSTTGRHDAQTRGSATSHRTINNFNNVLFFNIASSKAVIIIGACVTGIQHSHGHVVVSARSLRRCNVNTASV